MEWMFHCECSTGGGERVNKKVGAGGNRGGVGGAGKEGEASKKDVGGEEGSKGGDEVKNQ